MLDTTIDKTEVTPQPSTMDNLKSLCVGALFLLIAGFAVQSFFPWWSIAIVGFIGGAIFSKTYGAGYLLGFLAFSILWAVYAAIQSSANNNLMSENISGMLGGKVSAANLIYVSGLIGGLVGGFATASGAMFRNIFRK